MKEKTRLRRLKVLKISQNCQCCYGFCGFCEFNRRHMLVSPNPETAPLNLAHTGGGWKYFALDLYLFFVLLHSIQIIVFTHLFFSSCVYSITLIQTFPAWVTLKFLMRPVLQCYCTEAFNSTDKYNKVMQHTQTHTHAHTHTLIQSVSHIKPG